MNTSHKNILTYLSIILLMSSTQGFAIVLPPYNPVSNNPPSSIEDMIAQFQNQQQQLSNQLAQINQTINSLQSYLTAQKSTGAIWINATNGNYPNNAFTVFTNNQHAYHICHAEFLHGTHPGIINKVGCFITYGGYSLIEPTYQVLTGKLNTQWLTIANPTINNSFNSDGTVVYGGDNATQTNDIIGNKPQLNIPTVSSSQKNIIAVQGGFEKGAPLYICRAQYNNDSYIGKTVANNCNFAVGPSEVYVKNYEVLVAEIKKIIKTQSNHNY